MRTELVSVKTYIELKNFALAKINLLKKPVSHAEILFYYSAYFYHFDSLVDYMKTIPLARFSEKMELSFGTNNRQFLSKIRNTFAHKGEMISYTVHFGDGDIPYPVSFIDAKNFQPPKTYLLEIISFCEEKIGKVVLESLEEAQLFQTNMNENEIKKENLRTINRVKSHTHPPDFVKTDFSNFLSSIDFNKVIPDQEKILKELLLKKE